MVKCGKVNDFLGVDWGYSKKRVVKVSMIKYISNVIKEFPETIIGSAPLLAADHLFQVQDEDDPKYRLLSEEQAIVFHHTIAQLLFVSNLARRDIQTAVAFITIRVKKPDEDDWGTLKCILRYLNGTRYMKLTLQVENLSIVKWLADASYNVHPDSKGHTDGGMML